jgi:hypothetical protein
MQVTHEVRNYAGTRSTIRPASALLMAAIAMRSPPRRASDVGEIPSDEQPSLRLGRILFRLAWRTQFVFDNKKSFADFCIL